jgi:hypothetical protein
MLPGESRDPYRSWLSRAFLGPLAVVISHSLRIRFILFALTTTASTPNTAIVAKNIVIAMFTKTSEASSLSPATLHNWLFGGYILVLALAAVFSYLIWWSGNNVQEGIQAEARKRIAQVESDSKTEIARVENASKERIAQAARESNEKIAGLNKQAESLRDDAEKSRAEIARAQLEAATARKEAGDAIERSEKLREANNVVSQQLEKEKAERLALERYLSPRDIGDQLSFGRQLAVFKDITVLMVVIREMESRRLAAYISTALDGIRSADQMIIWRVAYVTPPENDFMVTDGICVFARSKNAEDKAEGAGRALVDLLNDRGVDSSLYFASSKTKDLPVNTIRVEVGMKPLREVSEAHRKLLPPPRQ